jgi:hypothetical protein
VLVFISDSEEEFRSNDYDTEFTRDLQVYSDESIKESGMRHRRSKNRATIHNI